MEAPLFDALFDQSRFEYYWFGMAAREGYMVFGGRLRRGRPVGGPDDDLAVARA